MHRSFSLFLSLTLLVVVFDVASALQSPIEPQHSLHILREHNDASTLFSSLEDYTNEPSLLTVSGGSNEASKNNNNKKVKLTIAILLPTLSLLFVFRDKWLQLFNKEFLQAKTLEILHNLEALPKYYSYTIYMLGMAGWEILGLSTIPVETAAGMVFGWTGLVLSASGKLLGAVIAFVIGRYGVLAEWIHDKLSSNTFLQLVEDSTETNPFLVVCLMKCSCFPETIKNYGSAILNPIKLWMFVVATMVHGWTFSSLWTYLGVDAAARLEDSSLPPNRRLEVLLGLALVNGVAVSPLSMAYWIKSLKEHQDKKKKS